MKDMMGQEFGLENSKSEKDTELLEQYHECLYFKLLQELLCLPIFQGFVSHSTLKIEEKENYLSKG